MVLLLFFYWVLPSWWYFYYHIRLIDTTSILKFIWWSFLSRFLLLAISITISLCSLLLLYFYATVYYSLVYQVCRVMSDISLQVLIQFTFILLLFVTLLNWRLTDMQYIALLCTPMIISMIIIIFQVKSFNDGILLVDPVISSTFAICTTSVLRYMLFSHRVHLLIIPPCYYANTFFNICFYIIFKTYFLTDCPTVIYYITFVLPWYMSFFFLLTYLCLSQTRRGEDVIQDSYLGLASMTEIWDLQYFRSINQN